MKTRKPSRNPLGRPPLPPEHRRSIKVTVYATAEEQERIRARARLVKKPISRVMVEAALTGEIKMPIPEENYEQRLSLIRLANLLLQAERLAEAGKLLNVDPAQMRTLREQVWMVANALIGRR